jgi:hypothetical protein
MLHSLVPEQLGGDERQYRANFSRLVDKGISAYLAGRTAVLAQIAEAQRPAREMQTGRVLYIFEFTNAMEDCVNATHRALLMLDRMKGLPIATHMPKTTRKLIETHVQEINDVRDVVEHMDAEIRGGNISHGQSVMLTMGRDQESIAIGGQSIRLDRLAGVLRNLHKLGHKMFDSQAEEFNSQNAPKT